MKKVEISWGPLISGFKDSTAGLLMTVYAKEPKSCDPTGLQP
jgi:hypothetical protein